MDTQEQRSTEMVGGGEYTELGIPLTEGDGVRQGEFLLRVYDQMLNAAETNFFRRPVIQTFDNQGNKTGWLAIPTLEDLKCALYEPGNTPQDLGLPDKVVNMHDIETAAYMSDSPIPLASLQALASQIMAMVTSTFDSYRNECYRSAGTSKIFDVQQATFRSYWMKNLFQAMKNYHRITLSFMKIK